MKRVGFSYELQPSLFKQDMDKDEFFEDTWEENILKMAFYQLLSVMLVIQTEWRN